MKTLITSLGVVGVLALAGGVRADPPADSAATLQKLGLYGSVGGGLAGFTQPTVASSTSLGGYWDARLGLGVRSIFGAEVGYVGASHGISALGLNSSAFLYNNGVEGVARMNAPLETNKDFLIEPYAFGGLGWQHFALGNVTTNTSDVASSTDVMTIPMGVGIGVDYKNITIDLRGTYHQALFSSMFGTTNSGFDANQMNAWGAGASIGFLF